jgi:general secretion pathway protein J
MVVEYHVGPANDSRARGRMDLLRRENPVVQGRMDRGGAEDVLFEGVKRVEFDYWDSQDEEWDDEWDTRRLERKAILPTRVRINVYALDENGKEVRYTTQVRIMLNTELPRYP